MSYQTRQDTAALTREIERLAGEDDLPAFGVISEELKALSTRADAGTPRPSNQGSPNLGSGPSGQEARGSGSRGRGGRGKNKGKGGEPSDRRNRTPAPVLKKARDSIEGFLKLPPAPLPEENAALEGRMDDMSTISSRLEEELNQERARVQVLEERLATLELSHNQLATALTRLIENSRTPSTKGIGAKSGSTTTASRVLSTPSPAVEKESDSRLETTQARGWHPQRGGGVAGRRRGGL